MQCSYCENRIVYTLVDASRSSLFINHHVPGIHGDWNVVPMSPSEASNDDVEKHPEVTDWIRTSFDRSSEWSIVAAPHYACSTFILIAGTKRVCVRA